MAALFLCRKIIREAIWLIALTAIKPPSVPEALCAIKHVPDLSSLRFIGKVVQVPVHLPDERQRSITDNSK